MFNRYWREFPWWLQLLQFVLMTGIFFGFATIIAYLLVPGLTGVPLTEVPKVNEHSSRIHIDALLLFQFITSLLAFAIPPFLFAYVSHPKPSAYLGLRRPGKTLHWLLSALLILSALPVMLALTAWLQEFDFGASVKKAQEQNDTMMKGLLQMGTAADFLKTFLVLAILPAVGEELFFRGIVMRMGAKIIKSPFIYIGVSAILFAWMHSNIYGLPAIFMAGAVLGTIYYLTGSIWCSILAHLINNGLQIILSYMANTNNTLKAIVNSNEVPWYLPVTGLVVFSLSFIALRKTRTPLPANWADDFTDEKPESTDNFTA